MQNLGYTANRLSIEIHTKYINQNNKLEYTIKEGKYKGLKGSSSYQGLTKMKKPLFISLTQESKNEYAKAKLEQVGMTLEGNPDVKTTTQKFDVTITQGTYKGYKARTSLATVRDKIQRGKIKDFAMTPLIPSEKARFMDTEAKKRGYEVLQYPEKYSATKPMKFKSPQGNVWKTSWNSFFTAKNDCPEDMFGASLGARMVYTILKENGYLFEIEKPIFTGTWQYIDFYLPEYKVAIEYHGQQHYHDTGGYYEAELEVIQERDSRKEQYCKDNGIRLIQVPYTERTLERVQVHLSSVIDVPVQPKAVLDYNPPMPNEEIIEYYKKHTKTETLSEYSEYGLSVSKLDSICRAQNYNKSNRRVRSTNLASEETQEYKSIAEAKRMSGCTSISEYLGGKNKSSTDPQGTRYSWEYL